MRSRSAKLPNQVNSPLVENMEKVKINPQRTPRSGWIQFFGKISVDKIYPDEMIFNLIRLAGSLGFVRYVNGDVNGDVGSKATYKLRAESVGNGGLSC
jgi:hypothetical protein